MCLGQKVVQTRKDRECRGAAVDGDVRAGRSGRGSEGEHWAVLGVGVPSRRALVQSPEAEVCGCAVGAGLTVEGEGRGSEGHGVGWTVLWEDLTFSSG